MREDLRGPVPGLSPGRPTAKRKTLGSVPTQAHPLHNSTDRPMGRWQHTSTPLPTRTSAASSQGYEEQYRPHSLAILNGSPPRRYESDRAPTPAHSRPFAP